MLKYVNGTTSVGSHKAPIASALVVLALMFSWATSASAAPIGDLLSANRDNQAAPNHLRAPSRGSGNDAKRVGSVSYKKDENDPAVWKTVHKATYPATYPTTLPPKANGVTFGRQARDTDFSLIRVASDDLDVAEAEENENSKADGNSATIAAPNPITDTDYEALVNNAAGFGQGVSGGLGAELCRVTSLEDKGAGTLRNCARKGNRWIVFDVSGEISLEKVVRIANDTTIDGRGADITLTNHGLSAVRRENIIIHNLKIERINGDGVTVFEAKNIWINHVTVGPTTDGTIDITDQSQNVTVSWSHIKEQDKTMLIGNRNDKVEDAAMTVTLHHNWYDNTFKLNPLVLFASVHMYNNVLSDWGEGEGGGSGVRAVYGAQMLLENNVFQAGTNKEAVLNIVPGWFDVPGYIKARGNSPLNGARVFSAEPDKVFEARDFYDYRLDTPTDAFMNTVKTYAGWQPASFFQSDVFAAEAGARTSSAD